MFLFLLMETAMLGLFASLDLIIFFIFWEFGLVPLSLIHISCPSWPSF